MGWGEDGAARASVEVCSGGLGMRDEGQGGGRGQSGEGGSN